MNRLSAIEEALKEKTNSYNQGIGYLNSLKKNKERIDKELKAKSEELFNLNSEKTILQLTSDEARESAKKLLENTVTSALQYVFDERFSAEIEIKQTGSKPSAEIYIATDYGDGNVVRTKPQDSRGGGVVDIVSIALRYAMMKLHQNPRINGAMILDEPGKHVSSDYSTKLAEFLEYISVTDDQQIIFVTHNDNLKHIAEKSYRVSIANGSSRAELSDDLDIDNTTNQGGVSDV